MKEKRFFIIILFVVMLIVLGGNVFADEKLLEVNILSQEYLDWLKLSEEEKKNTMEPFPFDIPYTRKSKSITLRSRMQASGKLEILPTSYDLREDIDVEVKNQGSTNSCWVFSSCSSLETHLSLKEETWNFSERHMEYSTASNFKDGQNKGSLDRRLDSGGNSYCSFAYYSRGDGPILEEDMPFENNNNEISINDLPSVTPVKHVEGMKVFPSIKKSYNSNNKLIYTDSNGSEYSNNELTELRNEIKEHIMKYGGISSVMNYTNSYYNEETASYNMNVANMSTNHVITIIGWDDNYSANNFTIKPSSDGAYIALNSWGESWGDNGIFYVSYEDNLIERYLSGITSVSDMDYDYIYQHDMSVISAYFPVQYSANVFTSQQDEILTEVVVALPQNQKCDIYINTNNDSLNIDELTQIASNISLEAGYNSIKLNNPIDIKNGNNFAVVVKIVDYNSVGVGLESNTYYPSVTSHEGESYYSQNGKNWADLYSASSGKNFIIKALTLKKDDEDIPLIESQVYEIEDQYILKITANTTLSDFIENISFSTEDYKILENDQEITDTGVLIKTGQILVINSNQYELVVTGDINGDGEVKASDLSAIKRTLIGDRELVGAYFKAADLNNDEKIKASDLSRLKLMLVGQ